MKRPVTLALVASLLIGATAFAGEVPRDALTTKMAKNVVYGDNHRPGNDRPGNDNRGNDHRGNDWNNRGNDRPDNDRHDWNNRGNDRRDSDRHDWNDRPGDHGRNDYRGYDHGRDDHDWNRHPNNWDNRGHDHVDYARTRYHYGYYAPPRGYYYRTWYRGDRLPYGWYSNAYIVHDWHPYHLYAPPYGYQWVRVGNDVVLTALATGVVLDVLYNIWF